MTVITLGGLLLLLVAVMYLQFELIEYFDSKSKDFYVLLYTVSLVTSVFLFVWVLLHFIGSVIELTG